MKQLVVIAALIALPLAADAGPKETAEAQAHISKATEAHQAGKFDVALTELETAYALDPQPDLLYAIGQVHVKLNDCPTAITYYEKFLETKPAPEPTTAATEAIATCREQIAAQAPPPAPEPQPAPPPAPPPPQPRRFDIIGTTLVGAGVVSTIIGVVMYSSAVNNLDDAENAPTYQEHNDLVDDAHSKRTISVVFTLAGAAAIGVGAWHYLHFRKSEQSRVSIAPTTRGGLVTWQGSF